MYTPVPRLADGKAGRAGRHGGAAAGVSGDAARDAARDDAAGGGYAAPDPAERDQAAGHLQGHLRVGGRHDQDLLLFLDVPEASSHPPYLTSYVSGHFI